MTKEKKEFKISVTGDLGSGKSTVCEILAKTMNAERVTLGTITRKVAADMNMDTIEFNKFIEGKPEYDEKFDDYQRQYEGKSGNYIIDSRLGFHFVPSTYSFYLKVDLVESARRIMNANRSTESYSSIEEGVRKIQERRESERARFKDFYGVDILDMSNYDCVIDTTNLTPQQVADLMIEKYLQKNSEDK
ncbi:MAG: cytidylate kinase family protein [Clostridia bacterium]|nr:cytidylate kinase family protein [Clostridia bacterium]